MKTDLAIIALQLYDEYEKLPTDRGGTNGPKGKAWQAFVDAKDKALNITIPEITNPLLTKIILGIIDQFGFDDKINENSNFILDLGSDELDMYEIVMWAECEWDIVIGDGEMNSLKTVGDLEKLIRVKANIL